MCVCYMYWIIMKMLFLTEDWTKNSLKNMERQLYELQLISDSSTRKYC